MIVRKYVFGLRRCLSMPASRVMGYSRPAVQLLLCFMVMMIS
jgi:hypothetical protein